MNETIHQFYARRPPDDYEISQALALLESVGYLVRKPSEVKLPLVVDLFAGRSGFGGSIAIRVDALINGNTLCVAHEFPIGQVLSPGNERFREQLPSLVSREIARVIGDSLTADVASSLAPKLKRLTPAEPMNWSDLEQHVNLALRDPRDRIDSTKIQAE